MQRERGSKFKQWVRNRWDEFLLVGLYLGYLLVTGFTKCRKVYRFRSFFFIVSTALVMFSLLRLDPDNGEATGIWLTQITSMIVCIWLAHFSRKALFDYPEADMRTLFRESLRGNKAAAMAILAQVALLISLFFVFSGAARAEVPPAAKQYLPVVKAEQKAYWPDHPYPPVLGGMIDKETCYSPTHFKCWNPKTALKTQREEGAGLGQITRTYRTNGTTRFDALAELKDRHPALRDWNWSNVYDRPDLQIRAVILKARDDYRAFSSVRSVINRLVFQVAAYNRGMGGVRAERQLCHVTEGCDPQLWFGHVEKTCTASRAPIYGGRSACDINRAHVAEVWNIRSKRYEGWL